MKVRTKLLGTNGQVREGAEELLAQWQTGQADTLWLDIEGELSAAIRAELQTLGLHQLAIADVERKRLPPKLEEFNNNTFILFRGIIQLDEDLVLTPQQIGFFVGERFLVTIHREESLSINRLWSEITGGSAPTSPGRLALQVMDYASDRYLQKILDFEAHLGEMEERLLSRPSDSVMAELVGYRSELRKLRRIFNYHNRLVTEILGEEPKFLGTGQAADRHLWRALGDRCERLFSLTSMYYEICGDLVEGYISISSHELNTTMKILTIITAIFVPLSFLAGLYGMNFENMPELHLEYGYFFALGAMASTAAVLVYIFKRKRWL
ncbi:MAG: magnesium transporter CorA family protein [Gammaproteobacteria bacterium]|nr:magnesium transporter CorA family protein [Gammaproteobacteria bacterium]MDH5171220.1 magnesium transporter CorA family protein [Gammaproteobacteria bacterium]